MAAVVLLALVSFGTWSALAHQTDCHDDCLRLVAHDASAHALGAAGRGALDPLHCFVCHLTRLAFNPPVPNRVSVPPAPDPGLRVPLVVVPVASGTRAAQPPLRAPPQTPAV